jgi:chromate transporter
MFFFDVSLLVLMPVAVALGIVLRIFRPGRCNGSSTTPESVPLLKPALKVAGSVLILWLMPLMFFYFFAEDFRFWRDLTLFFTKTAFVTIGGSYTVIPYVAHVAVSKLHWLTRLQMINGFALAETTPGPLIIVLAFVGFLAGYNHFQGSLWMGTLGLLATTFYTFLPCFFFVFAGAPLVERTQGNPTVEAVLGLITAVVAGAILDLTFFLGKAVIFPSGSIDIRQVDAISLGWLILSLLLVQKFKLKIVPLILLSVGLGLIRYVLGS